jgi:hypothetical protein
MKDGRLQSEDRCAAGGDDRAEEPSGTSAGKEPRVEGLFSLLRWLDLFDADPERYLGQKGV